MNVIDFNKMTSSRDISIRSGKKHCHVLRDIRAYIKTMNRESNKIKSIDWSSGKADEFKKDSFMFGVLYKTEKNNQNGQEYPLYFLNEKALMIVTSGYFISNRVVNYKSL